MTIKNYLLIVKINVSYTYTICKLYVYNLQYMYFPVNTVFATGL